MLKKQLKNKITDKKSIGKKQGGKANYRSVNNFQTIDRIPNDNLYKNDNIYSLNKSFKFPPNEEESFRLFCFHQYQKDGLKGILILFYLRFCCAKIYNFNDLFLYHKIFIYKNLVHLISFVVSMILKNEIYLKHNIYNIIIIYLFLFNQCLHIQYVYHGQKWKKLEYLELASEFFFNFCFSFFLDISARHIFCLQMAILFVYFKTVNSFLISSYIYFSFALLTFVLLMKSIREIWALYDSFKRSFHNINQGLLESDPNPIFIISKDKNILYKNNIATKLVNNILEAQPQNSPRKKQRAKESTINFLDIVHPNLKELFKKLLNDVMEDENVSSFNFPLCKVINQQNSDINVSNAYDIFDEKYYLYFAWFRIIVCKTEWKNKSAFYMCFYPSEDVLLNEIFYQYTKRFSEKIEKAISNSDIICAAFINKAERKIEKSESSHSSSSSSPSPSSSEDSESHNSSENEEKKNPEKKNKMHTLKKNIYQLLIENANNVELNNTILFFFKNQVEILYDYSLTIELYFNMLYKQRNFKYCFENTKPNLKKRIKLNEFKTYYLEYFYEFTREHKYQLAFKNDENNNNFDVFIEENYLRIILFNIIVFMICYFDDKSEPTEGNKKEIVIKIVPEVKDESSLSNRSQNENGNENNEHFKLSPKEYNEYEKSVKKGELSFIFESFSLKGDLNKIQELINQKNKSGSHLKSEIIKLNFLDVGILSVNYLLENYYKTKLEMLNKEGEQIIKFKIPCELEQINDINHSNKYNHANANITPDSNSFFSPIMNKRTLKVERIPKNFYNYNENYNRKVLNIFYGIVKSPVLSKRHKRANPSFCQNREIGNRNRRGSRRLSQNLLMYTSEPNKDKKEKNSNENKKENEEKINNKEGKQNFKVKSSNQTLSKFSVKQEDFSFNSDKGSFKSERVDHDEISAKEEDLINGNFNIELFEVEENEKKNENKFVENEVLIFESQNNKDLIAFLNNENKGEYIIKVVNNINEEEQKLKDNDGKSIYKVLLINMGITGEIKYAEKICKNKGESLIFGYHFGAYTRLREKNSVKYDKRFDLSFSFEGIVYALKQIFVNNTSII
jgi:hypothetical protein